MIASLIGAALALTLMGAYLGHQERRYRRARARLVLPTWDGLPRADVDALGGYVDPWDPDLRS